MAPKRKDPDQLYVRMAITLPPELNAQLLEYCSRHDRQKTWVIQKAVAEYLEHHADREEA